PRVTLGSNTTHRILSMNTTNINITLQNNVMSIITLQSYTNMDKINCSPKPGTAKICSITSVPVMIPTAKGPTTVTTGIKALRSTCLIITTTSLKPFALAVKT